MDALNRAEKKVAHTSVLGEKQNIPQRLEDVMESTSFETPKLADYITEPSAH